MWRRTICPKLAFGFLKQGRQAQVLMKDSTRPRALLYPMTAARDGQTGSVHIHGMMQHWTECRSGSGGSGLNTAAKACRALR
jgi:hypothetical protein